MPWKPRPAGAASSEQNHSRGSKALTDQVVQQQGRERERRRSFSQEQLRDKQRRGSGSGGGSAAHDGLTSSPGDHPSLRKRRQSAEVRAC